MSQLGDDLKALDTELAANWCKGKMTMHTAEGEKHCLLGAMAKVTTEMNVHFLNPQTGDRSQRWMAMHGALQAHVPTWGEMCPNIAFTQAVKADHPIALWAYNDDRNTQLEDVRNVVAKALAEAGE